MKSSPFAKSNPSPSYPHEWLAKAIWRSTSITFKVGATNEKQAQLRAEGQVTRMMGGIYCLEVKLIHQLY